MLELKDKICKEYEDIYWLKNRVFKHAEKTPPSSSLCSTLPRGGTELSVRRVFYVVEREFRLSSNHALLFADKLAKESTGNGKVEVEIIFINYPTGYYLGSKNKYKFYRESVHNFLDNCKVNKLKVHKLSGLPFETLKDFEDKLSKDYNDGEVTFVSDYSPLRESRKWKDKFTKHTKQNFYEVDAHNVVPVYVASNKCEFAAKTIRPKIHRNLDEYLQYPPNFLLNSSVSFPCIGKSVDPLIQGDDRTHEKNLIGGESQAQIILKYFLENKLENYKEKRNDATGDFTSNLSAYITHGNIWRGDIALQVSKTKIDVNAKNIDTKNTFLEELIVRAELAENYCAFNVNYDSFEGFHPWAKKTLHEHGKDVRDYLYTFKELEHAKTHDELWNAAQNEMVQKGKMSGYMRMYWAKKILEWTESPTQAMDFAVKLNDMYEIDSSDPNGYVGCAWSIGGVHDRPWFTRKIFGLVRYMARSGVEKQFDVKKYIAKWNILDNKENKLF